MKKVAVLLCGSGYLDGSEIRESVATLWALSQSHASVQCFAPDSPQWHTVNGLLREPTDESRNMLVESARIARSDVKPLSSCDVHDWDALIIPGGYGVAKNLCTYAQDSIKGQVLPEVAKILQTFHKTGKPIGAICIAPALLALTFKESHFELTVGSEGPTAQDIEKLGHRHLVYPADRCHVDKKNKIVSTPAYMYDHAPLHEIFEGIRKLVAATLEC